MKDIDIDPLTGAPIIKSIPAVSMDNDIAAQSLDSVSDELAKSTSSDNEATAGMYSSTPKDLETELRQILKDVGAGDSQQQEKVITMLKERMGS